MNSDKTITYNNISISLTKEINKQTKKEEGIFFTPPKTIKENLNAIKNYFKNIKSVLEPSCGSCEYIDEIHSLYPNIQITGIENNIKIFEAIKEKTNETIKLYNSDFLKFNEDKKYDLIIGNPPYFVMKKWEVHSKYYDYFDGRPNIFILFIIKSLELLNDKGIMSFILPKGFINCLYYEKTRVFIKKNYKIINIINCQENFNDTQQDTIILIVQKSNPNKSKCKFTFSINNYTIFGFPYAIKRLNELNKGSKTLNELGFSVNVGTIVWNQCKDILSNDKSKTRLIYSSDITENKLDVKSYKNEDKKNFIDKKGTTLPTLVVNRGYGIMAKYKFNYCLIDVDYEYLIENHLICINYTRSIEKNVILEQYEKIINSLEDERTKEFIQLYFGNNAINTTELSNILPIYLS
tara:strand:- start:2233 stop:3456 length:1224 start_codon:yes stop_codon:yes gene_type:complete